MYRAASMNRVLDAASRRGRSRRRRAGARGRGARDQARGRRPVFYRQTRVGKDGEDFALLKLRTMIAGAETQGAGYAVDAGDPRITRVGAFLRRTSLDELPQLLNVLRGDMSLIGPRPTLRYQVERYNERQRRRLDVKPGITGWAQIHGRAALPWDERHRARRLVRRAPLAARRPEDPAADAAGAARRHLQGRDGRVASASRSRGAAVGSRSTVSRQRVAARPAGDRRGLERVRPIRRGGYDAAEHIAYASRYRGRRACPRAGAYYTPPVFYAPRRGRASGCGDAAPFSTIRPGGRSSSAPLSVVGTALLVLALARVCSSPGGRSSTGRALAFFVACPLVPRICAMFHPQPLVAFLSTLALVLTARMIVRGAPTVVGGGSRSRSPLAVALARPHGQRSRLAAVVLVVPSSTVAAARPARAAGARSGNALAALRR